MSPKTNNNSGDIVGYAASGTANRRDAAFPDDLHVIGRSLAVIVLAAGVLAFNAPELWPHLFAH